MTPRAILLTLLTATTLAADPIPLFDGKTLDGWSVREGEEKWWSVQDGALTGGSLEERVPRNSFLVFDRSFENFELTYQLRFVQGEGFQNSGLQIRSIRIPDSHQMIGYQVDAGKGYWGDLYDESRRAKLTGPVDPEALKAVVHDWDWNKFRVLCEGPRIRAWINDVLVTDFTEKDDTIPRDGIFGMQAHSNGKFLVQMKDVFITELPPTPNAATWEKPAPDPDAPREPEEQKQSFKLPDGFTAELVASEAQGLNKPITVSWDRHGRMWSMTAVEYPVDANEDREAAEALFAAGGRDRLLVFDEPNLPTIQTPRTFAEGLALPLGVLPMKDGVLAQYGTEIRRYINDDDDDDGDGTANRHETVLTGFGIEDSHLFPHQFERPPGGWIYVAQGAFNRSEVRRPDGSPFASRRVEADTWIHCAIVRDADGRFTLYFDGEPDPATGTASTADFTGLNLGETTARNGTAAQFDEFRVWNTARSAADIRAHHRVAFEDSEKPDGLVHRITATTADPTLDGTAAIVPSADFPELQTPEQQRAAEARFQHFRALASQPGDIARGKQLAQVSCLICHQVQDEGVAIGPDLSGAGAMGIDSLLRNILTPNEMLESGYYRHDIRLTDGTFASDLFAYLLSLK